ncbi:MAG: TetR/AcrR family transcriptional regulator [Gammaproteobacteria bacterium]|nr:TetR/AcrR family transcriptional regulator [Gammaproteobacteria bacterium]
MVFCNQKSDSPCRWKRRKEARPEEIMDAALELFAEKGFSATRMADVAKKAGISKGTLYLYFDNKEAIFRSVVQEMILPQVDQHDAMIANYTGSAESLLRELLHGWWQAVMETKLSAIPKLIISESGNFPEMAEFFVKKVVLRSRQTFIKVIQYGIDKGEFKPCNPITAARLAIAPLVHASIWMHSLKAFDENHSDEDYLELHINLLLQGLSS